MARKDEHLANFKAMMKPLALKGRSDILCVLAETPGTSQEVAKHLGLATRELNRRIRTLHEHGLVVHEDNGIWRLSPKIGGIRLDTHITFSISTGGGYRIEFGIVWPKPA